MAQGRLHLREETPAMCAKWRQPNSLKRDGCHDQFQKRKSEVLGLPYVEWITKKLVVLHIENTGFCGFYGYNIRRLPTTILTYGFL